MKKIISAQTLVRCGCCSPMAVTLRFTLVDSRLSYYFLAIVYFDGLVVTAAVVFRKL